MSDNVHPGQGSGRLLRIGVGLIFMARLMAAEAATSTPISVCTDYHCDDVVSVTLSSAQLQQVSRYFDHIGNAEQERQQIRQAIALLETQVGEQAGTWRDRAKNAPQVSNQPGQLDCISESKNTTTYLKLLAANKLLHWHVVEDRKKRAPWFFDVHWAAVIRDTHTDTQYAVDSWFLDNGELPYVQRLQDWVRGKNFE